MLLSDRDLHTALDTGELALDPLDRDLIQPSSIDVRLDNRFRVLTQTYREIDPAADQPGLTLPYDVPAGESFTLRPGQFVLGSTLETVTIGENLAARIEGKSSLGRLGLLLHVTAGFIDPGFTGRITLELVNVTSVPLKLWPGMRIGQMCAFRLSSPPLMPYGSAAYGSRYQGQTGPTPSRSHQDWRVTPIPTP